MQARPFAKIIPPTVNCPVRDVVGDDVLGDGVLGSGLFVEIDVETFVGIAVGMAVEVEVTELFEGALDGVPPVFAMLPLLPITVITIPAIKIHMTPNVRMSVHTGI